MIDHEPIVISVELWLHASRFDDSRGTTLIEVQRSRGVPFPRFHHHQNKTKVAICMMDALKKRGR